MNTRLILMIFPFLFILTILTCTINDCLVNAIDFHLTKIFNEALLMSVYFTLLNFA